MLTREQIEDWLAMHFSPESVEDERDVLRALAKEASR